MGTFTGYAPCSPTSGPCDTSNDHYLSGTLYLDESAPFVDWIMTSPLQQPIFGQFGEYSFEGNVYALWASEYPGYMDFAPEYWIVRAAVTSPIINGLSLTSLHLFVYTSPSDSRINQTIYPARTSSGPSTSFNYNYQYGAGFSDGSFASGNLSTVQVPDAGPTWSLMLIAGVALFAFRPRRSIA